MTLNASVTREEIDTWAKNRRDDAGRLARAYLALLDSQKLSDGMTDREKLIREGFCFDSDRDCDAAKYLIGVIDTARWDRKLLRDRITTLEEQAAEAEKLRVAFVDTLNETALFCKRVMDDFRG